MEKETLNMQLFIQNLEQQFQDPGPAGLHPQTLFRDLPEWSSLQALVVIVSFDDNYGVTIDSDELRRAKTVEDLFHLVTNKIRM